MKISMIAAISENGVIGKNGDLPWKLPIDMKFFKAVTIDHHIILGRKNYESIPERFRPLPGRTNIVMSRDKSLTIEDCITVTSMEEALAIADENGENEVFIIGGGEIYKTGLVYADKMYITEVHAHIEGDVYFPSFNKSEWIETSRIKHPKDEKHNYAFDFVTYIKA